MRLSHGCMIAADDTHLCGIARQARSCQRGRSAPATWAPSCSAAESWAASLPSAD
jgi:hypothetical protein